MAKDLSAIAVELAKPLGTEPLFSVDIKWGFTGPQITYTDEDKILSASDVDTVIKLDAKGSTGSMTLTLDDTDESIRAILEATDIQKGLCKVYQYYKGAPATRSLLLTGEIFTPIIWDEGSRSVTLDIVTRLEAEEVGYSVEEGEQDFVSEEAIGKAWPLCFGSPLKVPALKLTSETRGTSRTRYKLVTKADLNSICEAAKTLKDATSIKTLNELNTLINEAQYTVAIENLTSATISLNVALANAITDSPAKEANLRLYADHCKDLRGAERNQELYTSIIVDAEARITDLEDRRDAAQDQLTAETLKANPDAGLIAQLTADIALYQTGDVGIDGIDDYENTKNAALASLATANSNITIFTNRKDALEPSLLDFDLTSIAVEDGEEFPQAVTVEVIINGARFQGVFSGKALTFTSLNLPTHTSIPLGTRLNDNHNEFWITDPTLDLRGQYCFFSGKGIVYVEDQIGTNCFINPILYKAVGNTILTGLAPGGGSLTRINYNPILLVGSINETSVIIRPSWLAGLDETIGHTNGLSAIRDTDYRIEVGDDVYLSTDYQDIYIANLIPSTAVHEVFAYRSIDGLTKLVPVPSSYYAVDLSEAIAGQSSTTLRFPRPLTQYVGEDWSEDIYVSLTSSVGPNTASIIDYLVTTWTNFTSDAATLATLVATLTNYPSHFALFDRRDALALIEDIAWQARSAVYVENEKVYYKYLAVEEAAIRTITESDIELRTLRISYTSTDDLRTKLTAIWQSDYLGEDDPKEVIVRNNIPKYGKIEEEYDFFIYNIQGLVSKSISFWMYRLSNTYKMLEFTAMVHTLELNVFDSVDFTFIDNYVATGTSKGVVQSAIYDSSNQTITYRVLMSIRAGEMSKYPFFWSGDATIAFPGPNDLYAGGA